MARNLWGPIAQWLELAAHNRLVPGSSPGGPTNQSWYFARFIAGSSKVPYCGQFIRRTRNHLEPRLLRRPMIGWLCRDISVAGFGVQTTVFNNQNQRLRDLTISTAFGIKFLRNPRA
jgi:hypothetical protein